MGLLALPSYVGETVPGLHRVSVDDFNMTLDLWLLTHPDLQGVTHIRAMLDFLAEQVRQDQLTLADCR